MRTKGLNLLLLLLILNGLSSCRSFPVIGSWSAPRFGADSETILFTAVVDSTARAMKYFPKTNKLTVLDLPVPIEDGTSEPTMSPDGKTVAFIWEPKGRHEAEIWLIDSDSTRIQQITTSGMRHSDLFFSQDGKKLGFTRTNSEFRSGFSLGFVDLETKQEHLYPQTESYMIISRTLRAM